MSKEIKGVHLKFDCPAEWDRMQELGNCKFCELCQKKVYDFTDKKAEDFFEALAHNQNNICGKFRSDQLALVGGKSFWKKWIAAVFVLLGLNIYEHQANAQKGAPHNNTTHRPGDGSEIKMTERLGGGEIKPSPSYPGGEPALFHFIYKRLRHVKNAPPGRTIACFDITKAGKVKDVTIVRGTSREADKEVRRVLRTVPDWIPAQQNGKAVASQYYLPVYVLSK